MVTLFASLIGFIGSVIPDIFKAINDRRDKAHELAIMDRQMTLQERGIYQKLEEIQVNAENNELRILHQNYKSGISWIDMINALVRPILAYSFFVLYASVKYMQFVAIEKAGSWSLIYEVFWSLEDQAIFSGIISFYFGQRAMFKRMQQQK